MKESFRSWEHFAPCDPTSGNKFDLYLIYSGDLSKDKEVEKELFLFNDTIEGNNAPSWRKCFQHIVTHGSNLPETEDIYLPSQAKTLKNWVLGPNLHFAEISRFGLKHFLTSLWYLMEMDSIPIKDNFLDLLLAEINQEIIDIGPFIVFGSIYRGDKWDSILEYVPPSLRYHINGNAVYNNSHPLFKTMIDSLEQDVRLSSSIGKPSVPYDLRLSELFYQKYPHLFRGQSQSIGNYAATNIISEFLRPNEAIIHGATFFERYKDGLGLVVSDWGEGDYLKTFHENLINAVFHPFSEVVYVVPYHRLVSILDLSYDIYLPLQNRSLRVSYYSRDAPADYHWPITPPSASYTVKSHPRPTPDYADHCFYQPMRSRYFMTTNTFSRVASPISLFWDDHNRTMISFLKASSTLCQDNDICRLTEKESRRFQKFLGSSYYDEKIVYENTMIYDVELMGNLDKKNGFCHHWKRHVGLSEDEALPLCQPLTGPTSTLYYQYVRNKEKINSIFSDVLQQGVRDAFFQNYFTPNNLGKRPLCDFFGENLSHTLISKKNHIFPRSEVGVTKCNHYVDNKKGCSLEPTCMWKEGFDKCIFTGDIINNKYVSHGRQLDDLVSYPTKERHPHQENGHSLSASAIVGISLGAVGGLIAFICSAIPLLLFIIRCCKIGEERTGPTIHYHPGDVETFTPIPVVAANGIFYHPHLHETITCVSQAPVARCTEPQFFCVEPMLSPHCLQEEVSSVSPEFEDCLSPPHLQVQECYLPQSSPCHIIPTICVPPPPPVI